MYTSIVVSGGAMKVVSNIGIIRYLEEKDILQNIKNFVGTSGGAIVCLMLALGFTSNQMKDIVLEIINDKELTNFEPEGILDILETYGIKSYTTIEKYFNKLIHKKFYVSSMTFMELAKITGKNLIICVSNLTKEESEFFSVDTTPNLSIAKAVAISCAIPVLFSPIKINDNLYVDGGLYNNFPIDYFPESQLRDILGINITCINYQNTDNFLNYVNFVIASIVKKFNQRSVNCKDKNIITLEFDDKQESWFSLSEIKISLTNDKIDTYIQMGYDAMSNKNI
jgi:predicted acylesterase/phospholipase RssA